MTSLSDYENLNNLVTGY